MASNDVTPRTYIQLHSWATRMRTWRSGTPASIRAWPSAARVRPAITRRPGGKAASCEGALLAAVATDVYKATMGVQSRSRVAFNLIFQPMI